MHNSISFDQLIQKKLTFLRQLLTIYSKGTEQTINNNLLIPVIYETLNN